MENQHRKITGYRELTADEIGLMNEVKAHAEKTRILIEKITSLRESQLSPKNNGPTRKQLEESFRCLKIAQTDLQQGFMWLVRSVALPESF
jgi:hypothetical protein